MLLSIDPLPSCYFFGVPITSANIHSPHLAFCNILAKFNEIDSIFTRDLLVLNAPIPRRLHRPYLQLTNVCARSSFVSQKNFFFCPYAVDRLDQASGEHIRECPYNLVTFFIQKFAVGFCLIFFYNALALSACVAASIFAVNYFSIFYIIISINRGITTDLPLSSFITGTTLLIRFLAFIL